MGQYHHAICVDAQEGLDPHQLGCGLKAAEQLFTRPGTCAALVALICARGGNMPADCSQSALIGRWAGKRVLVQGDYAQDGDIPGWNGPALSKLYSAMRPANQREPWDGMPESYWDSIPLFSDISDMACGFLEAACNVRFFTTSWGGMQFVAVKPMAQNLATGLDPVVGGCGVAEYVIDPCYTTDGLAFFKRCGLQPIDIQRVPRSGDWHGLRPHEVTEGQRRVIVNLDTLEYLDPARFGQVPTLAGMLADRSPPPWPKPFEKADPGGVVGIDMAGALFTLLTHAERRGGGDIPNTREEAYDRGSKSVWKGAKSIQGRWRGHRVLGTAEFKNGAEDWPTTDEVIERGTDISDMAIRYLVAVSHF